jgi:hypothetical protein
MKRLACASLMLHFKDTHTGVGCVDALDSFKTFHVRLDAGSTEGLSNSRAVEINPALLDFCSGARAI